MLNPNDVHELALSTTKYYIYIYIFFLLQRPLRRISLEKGDRIISKANSYNSTYSGQVMHLWVFNGPWACIGFLWTERSSWAQVYFLKGFRLWHYFSVHHFSSSNFRYGLIKPVSTVCPLLFQKLKCKQCNEIYEKAHIND